jgi:hypothetical protein
MPPKAAADVAVFASTGPPLALPALLALVAALPALVPALPALDAALVAALPALDAALVAALAALVVELLLPELLDELQAVATIATAAIPTTAAIRIRAVCTDPPVEIPGCLPGRNAAAE